MKKKRIKISILLIAVILFSTIILNGIIASESLSQQPIRVEAKEENENILKISTANELVAFASNVNSGNTYEGWLVELTSDIDMLSVAWNPIGYNFNNYFAGVFDGNNHVISNLNSCIWIDSDNIINTPYHVIGLFGVCSSAKILNVTLYNPTFSIKNESGYQNDYSSIDGTSIFAGSLCGYSDNTIIKNITVSGVDVSSYTGAEAGKAYAGGIVGYARNNCEFSYCTVESGNVSGNSDSAGSDCFAGGIVGEMLNAGNIVRCANYASINGGHSMATAYTGGICGKTSNTSETLSLLRDCYNQGNVFHVGSWLESGYVGGIIGYSYSSVINCYSTGTVKASTNTILGNVIVSGISGSGTAVSNVENCVNICDTISGGTSNYVITGADNKDNNYALDGISGSPINDATETYPKSKFMRSSFFIETLDWDYESIWQQANGELPTFYVQNKNDTDMEIVNEAIKEIHIIYSKGEDYSSVKNNISFSSSPNLAVVTWFSNNEDVINNEGVVNRGNEDIQVKITAKVSSGNYSLKKIFVLNVLGTVNSTKVESKEWAMDVDSAISLVALMRNCKYKDVSVYDTEVQVLTGNNNDEDAIASYMVDFMKYLEVPGENAFLKSKMGDVIGTIKSGINNELSDLVGDFSDGLVDLNKVNAEGVAKTLIAIPRTFYYKTRIDYIGSFKAIKDTAEFSNDQSLSIYENTKEGVNRLNKVVDCMACGTVKISGVISNIFTAFELFELYKSYEIAKQNATKSYIKQYLDLREKYEPDSEPFQLLMKSKAVTSLKTDVENIDEFCENLYKVYDKFTNNFNDEYKIIIKCPVNVFVYNKDGYIVGRVINNKVDHSIKNSLMITIDGKNSDEKTIHVQDSEEYSIKLVGTDEGTMEVEVTTLSGNVNYKYKNIPLLKSKEMILDISAEQLKQNEKKDIIVLENGIYTEKTESVDSQITFHSLKIYVCEEDKLGNVSLNTFNTEPIDMLVMEGKDISKLLRLRDDCILLGYYTDIECMTIYEYLVMPNTDLVLYAKCIKSDKKNLWEYELLEDGTVEITAYKGNEPELEIPESIDGVSVTRIGSSVFESNLNLKKVIIPNSITEIGRYAFSECYTLESVEIPDSVILIDNYAFYQCTNLKSVIGGRNVENIGVSIFSSTEWIRNQDKFKKDGVWYCSLGKVQIVCEDGMDFAKECSYERTEEGDVRRGYVELPDGTIMLCYGYVYDLSPIDGKIISSIGWDAFCGINGWGNGIEADIVIPEGIEYISVSAYHHAGGINSVIFPSTMKSIARYAFAGTHIDGYGEGFLSSVTFNDGLVKIGQKAFLSQPNLKSVVIPSSVTEIGEHAFGYYINYDEDDDMSIPPWEIGERKYSDFTIYGYPDTAAEVYAKENGFRFISLKDEQADNSITLSASGEFSPRLEMSNDEALSVIAKYLTEEQLSSVKAGKLPLDIRLIVKLIDESVSEADKDLIAKAIAEIPDSEKLNFKVLNYLDISLGAAIDGKELIIPETDGAVTVSIALEKPANENYKIVRIHGGKAEVIDAQLDKDGKRLIFKTDKFSTYAVICSDLASGGSAPILYIAVFLLAGLTVIAAGVAIVIKAFKAYDESRC